MARGAPKLSHCCRVFLLHRETPRERKMVGCCLCHRATTSPPCSCSPLKKKKAKSIKFMAVNKFFFIFFKSSILSETGILSNSSLRLCSTTVSIGNSSDVCCLVTVETPHKLKRLDSNKSFTPRRSFLFFFCSAINLQRLVIHS